MSAPRCNVAAFCFALALITASKPAYAVSWTTIDDPLAVTATTPSGLSGNNIVGTYYPSSEPYDNHGFLYNGSTWTTLDAPLGTNGTFINGIDGNNLVGSYTDSSYNGHGFLYNGTTWTTLDNPSAGPNGYTYAYCISGDVIGGVYGSDQPNDNHGFLFDGTAWDTIDFPGSVYTELRGISGNQFVGVYTDADFNFHGYLFDGANWNTIDVPSGHFTSPTGVSDGKVVGHYAEDGDPLNLSHGFLFDGSTYTFLDYPQSRYTSLNGIVGDQIVGSYIMEGEDIEHGLLATIPEPSSIVLAAFGFLSLAAIRRRSR